MRLFNQLYQYRLQMHQTPLKTIKLSLLELPLLLMLTLLLAACGGSNNAAIVVGNPAPNFQLSAYSDNRTVNLSDFKGKPVMLNFWATWCAACQVEMPMIEAAYQQHQKDNLVVLGINMREDSPTIAKFLQDKQVSWPILLDLQGKVVSLYNVVGYPTSIFIDRKGVIRAIQVGSLDSASFPNQLAAILNQ